jgi:hypothetical protein
MNYLLTICTSTTYIAPELKAALLESVSVVEVARMMIEFCSVSQNLKQGFKRLGCWNETRRKHETNGTGDSGGERGRHAVAPAHYANIVTEILGEKFPRRWIGKGERKQCPLPWIFISVGT